MYYNTCSKCGQEFETKNPKRVVCPDCLYPDRPVMARPAQPAAPTQSRPPGGGGYGPPGGGYGGGGGGRPFRPPGGGYGPPGGQGGPGRGYGPPGGGPRRGPGGPPGGGPRRGPGGPPGRGGFGGPRRGPGGPPRRGPGGPKKLLVTKEQLAEIETRYKAALPLPNPDLHETIGQEMDMQPSKVFFAINLIRAKMKLPKLDYPKRKLAVSPDQMMAVESLYEPYLPLPPIGIHKIIAKQLKMDEWRVHVAIGLIRKSKNMTRWNEDREDLPETMKKALAEKKVADEAAAAEKAKAAAEAAKNKPAEDATTSTEEVKAEEAKEDAEESAPEEDPSASDA